LDFLKRQPPGAVDNDPQPNDHELVGFGFRRPVFERAIRGWVTRQPRIELRCDTEVKSLLANGDGSVPRVRGVVLGDGSTLEADLVVAATGRHGAATRWLSEIGAGPVEESEADAGLTYFSRYYRVAPGASFPHQYGPPVYDAGSINVFTFPADHGTFTLAATPLADDAALRRLKDNDAFDRVMRALPRTRPWLEETGAEPITDVAPLARIEDRRHRLVVDGRPAARGILFTADSAFCTNPILGRGTSLAWLSGRRLAEAVAAHGDDLEKVALSLDEVFEQELRPWYEDSLATDRQRFAVMRAAINGEPAPQPADDDIGAQIARAIQFALPFDGVVYRAGVRRFNLLDPLDAVQSNTDVITRAIGIWERRAELPSPPPPPSRDELLAALAG
jgi:2-polyprenyl-6-methoxyphenol hydroxylase-like FAD-dependent oxidoreductase